MPNITIQGHSFEVPADPGIVAGAVLDENMAHSLQQTRLENIRNNMAARIKKMLGEATELTAEQAQEAQVKVNEYAQEYKFGVRGASGPRVVRDPVEREMQRLAKEVITKAYRAKYDKAPDKETLAAAVERLLEARHDEYAKDARRNLAAREKAGNDVLEAAGI